MDRSLYRCEYERFLVDENHYVLFDCIVIGEKNHCHEIFDQGKTNPIQKE